MVRVVDILRALFISPEFLMIVLLGGIYTIYPNLMSYIGIKIKLTEELWKYLFTLPFIFTAIAIRQSAKIRAPLENTSNKDLYHWEFYHRITDRVNIGVFYVIVSSLCVVFIFIFQSDIEEKIIGVVFVGSLSISGIVALSMMFAPQKLKELLQKYGE